MEIKSYKSPYLIRLDMVTAQAIFVHISASAHELLKNILVV